MELNKKIVNFESMNENTKLTLAEALLYTKGLAGGYGGDFPLSTASKDSIYRVPATNKFYVCTENYNGSQISAPNSNFVELSVWKNHDRLNNLIKMKNIFSGTINKAGLKIQLIINSNKIATSVYVRGTGEATENNPFIFQLPLGYRPLVIHRLAGFNGADVLIFTDGQIQLSCSIGNNFQNSHFEIGYTFLNIQ